MILRFPLYVYERSDFKQNLLTINEQYINNDMIL